MHVNLFPARVGLAILYEKRLFKDMFLQRPLNIVSSFEEAHFPEFISVYLYGFLLTM